MDIAYRFIPTPVGNSRNGMQRESRSPVHPHACGELKIFIHAIIARIGSSPRLWGTLLPLLNSDTIDRFIPTPVGNSLHHIVHPLDIQVHPHACGELERIFERFNLRLGSSPRLWGTPRYTLGHILSDRFIPTPVGNSKLEYSMGLDWEVHPHACGELIF